MKRNILLGTVAILLAVGCGKTPQSTGDIPPSPSDATALEPAPAATPMPHHFAPHDVFFLTEKVKLETPDGVLGYPPGTKVIRVSGAYVTPDGKRIAARADQMTNDLEVAQQLAGQDAAAQTAIKNTLGSLAPAGTGAGSPLPPGSRSTTFSTVTTGPDGAQKVHETTIVNTTSVNPVTAQIKELEKQKQLLFLQIDEQHAALRSLTNRNPRKSPEAEQINLQIASLREQIRTIDGQLAVVRASR